MRTPSYKSLAKTADNYGGHCLHEFTTWPAFFYHVNARSCSGLREYHEKANAQRSPVAEDLAAAVVEDKEILQLTRAEMLRERPCSTT